MQQCAYCGSSYPDPVPAPPVPLDEQSSSAKENQPGQDVTSENDAQKNGCGLLFLACCIVLVILAQIHKYTGFATGLLVADNSVPDTIQIDSNQMLNFPTAEGLYQKKHIKKSNPDPEILINRSKIVTTRYFTKLSITFRNKTKPEQFMSYIAFNFRVFDKNGKEIKTGDSNTRDSGVKLQQGESTMLEWSLTERIPKAKTAKVELKQVEFNDVIWDY